MYLSDATSSQSKIYLPSTTILQVQRTPPSHVEQPSIPTLECVSFIPRDLDVFTPDKVKVEVGGEKYRLCVFVSSQPAPAILHVSKEARKEGLRYYKLIFGTDNEFGCMGISTPPRIYVNTWSDRICFVGQAIFDARDKICGSIIAYNIRKIAVNAHALVDDANCIVDLFTYSTEWCHLDMDEIVIYNSDIPINQGDNIGFVEATELEREALERIKIIGEDPMQFFEADVLGLKIEEWDRRRKDEDELDEGTVLEEELKEMPGPQIRFMALDVSSP
ncbi:hypothetical protein N431DRAFT_449405 [Stipitochalara longipes BDJ]|nr:hypothetical protein N431DRAFT_449405 [Stipitochalara longipes BDJ]